MSESVAALRKKEKQREAKRHKAQREKQKKHVTSQHIIEEIAKLDRAARQQPNDETLRQRRARLVNDLEKAQRREEEEAKTDQHDTGIVVEGLDLIIAADELSKPVTSIQIPQTSNSSNTESINANAAVRPWLDHPPGLNLPTQFVNSAVYDVQTSVYMTPVVTAPHQASFSQVNPIVSSSSHSYHAQNKPDPRNHAHSIDPMLGDHMGSDRVKRQKTGHSTSVAGRVSSFVASLGKHGAAR